MARLVRVIGAIGAITRLFSLAFLVPLLVALLYEPFDVSWWRIHLPRNAVVFIVCAVATLVLGHAMQSLAKWNDQAAYRDRDAVLTVGLGWLWLCAVGMMPFVLSGVLANPLDAYFETMSGLTTTGATVITARLETVPASIMMWRALLQFIGGMGIVVLSVAVLARFTQGGIQLLQAEAPGPTVTRLAPRLAQTARILWGVYLGMAAVLFVLLLGAMAHAGLGAKAAIYDALLHTFTTMSTGGFSNHDASIAHYDDWLIEAIIIVFMLAAAVNFTLHYRLVVGRSAEMLRDPEWRLFMAVYLGTVVLIAANLAASGTGAMEALRSSAFTVASLISSTGFATADFDAWPAFAKLTLLFIMVTGGTAGSTAGGLKHVRALVILKLVRQQFQRIMHPKAVNPSRLGGRIIQPATAMAAGGFLLAYVAVWIIGSVALLLVDPAHFHDPIDAASASISALSNMGPGFGVVGPSNNFAGLTAASEVILAMEMWFGRLEVFTALLVFTPETWRH